MPPINAAYLAHQLKRWMRPDAHHFIRPDSRRFARPGFADDHPFTLSERKYRPDQARVPAGSRDGGQWTDGDGGSGDQGGANDPRVLSDASPEPIQPGAQYAQNGPRRSGAGAGGGGRGPETPAQSARLAVVEAQARDALARVRELDPNWRPTPSIRETVEGQIVAAQAETREAQARLSELSRVGIGPGPFAGESIPARGPERDFTAAERRDINRIGSETGCHTCGTKNPETRYGDYILDHQIPNRLNSSDATQRLFPHCATCSARQGGYVKSLIPRY